MDIMVDVVGQRLQTATNLTSFIAGTQEFIRFVFNLDGDWADLLVFAQFTQNGVSYNQYLDQDNGAYLPAEITAGTCTMTLFGSYGNKRATTNYIRLDIEESSLTEDGQSTEITLSLYEQLVTEVQALSTAVDRVENELETLDVNDIQNRLGGLSFLKRTQDQYNAIASPDENTVYIIVG